MIRVTDLRKRYPGSNRDVLAGVDVTIADGEFVSLVGRSGCGKTTLLNIIGGLDRSWDGIVEVMGRVLKALDDAELASYRRNDVGFVFQAYHLLDHLSCRENVALAARFASRREHGGLTAEKRRAEEVLELVGLAGATELRPSRLSGGERQRVAIARALFNRPRLLLLDEPTGNLDNATGAEILDLLARLHADTRLTLIAATHDGSIETAGGRLLRMTDGVVVATAGDDR